MKILCSIYSTTNIFDGNIYCDIIKTAKILVDNVNHFLKFFLYHSINQHFTIIGLTCNRILFVGFHSISVGPNLNMACNRFACFQLCCMMPIEGSLN
ncbi:hypothetical protein BLOT_000156 [Blomia tropicalis]|nr:hypothetical protein BLOT_000156 [Blomia tropicalis]